MAERSRSQIRPNFYDNKYNSYGTLHLGKVYIDLQVPLGKGDLGVFLAASNVKVSLAKSRESEPDFSSVSESQKNCLSRWEVLNLLRE